MNKTEHKPNTIVTGPFFSEPVHVLVVDSSGTGRGEAMKRFLVDDGAGNDQRFWSLAQALSALYPASSTEKRWVDGVLARKKGLGL